jgi:hypothetical protein
MAMGWKRGMFIAWLIPFSPTGGGAAGDAAVMAVFVVVLAWRIFEKCRLHGKTSWIRKMYRCVDLPV